MKVYENTAELQSACVGKEASLMHIYIWKDLHATSDLLTENPGVNPSMAGCGVMCKSKLKKQKRTAAKKRDQHSISITQRNVTSIRHGHEK